jgi:hypothetical protein
MIPQILPGSNIRPGPLPKIFTSTILNFYPEYFFKFPNRLFFGAHFRPDNGHWFEKTNFPPSNFFWDEAEQHQQDF